MSVLQEVEYLQNKETPGGVLARERRMQNLQIVQISNYLHLSPWQIEALENDQYKRLPGATFVRGIIRNYAKVLHIDPEPLVHAYARISHEEPLPIQVPTQNIRFKVVSYSGGWNISTKSWLVVFALFLTGASGWLWYTQPVDQFNSIALIRENTVSVLKQSPQLNNQINTAAKLEPPAAPVLSQSPAQTSNASTDLSSSMSTVNSTAGVENKTSSDSKEEAILRLTFKDKSWVDVKDGEGSVLLHQLNNAGSEQLINGKPPFSLVIGNAKSVSLAYNDKDVDLTPYIKTQVARFTLE